MMKHLPIAIASLLFILTGVACSKNEKGAPTGEFITKLELLGTQHDPIVIDNATKNILIPIYENQDLNNVQVRFSLAAGATMLSPAQAETTLNLRTRRTISLSVNGQEIQYRLEVTTLRNPSDDLDNFDGWTLSDAFGALPDGIRLYKSPAQLQGKNAVAYIAVADISKGKNFTPLGAAQGYTTLTNLYQNEATKHAVLINAGYFWDGSNLSLLYRDGQLISPNVQTVNRNGGSGNVPFYPTRGSFGQTADNKFQADWVFTTVSPRVTYAYPQPAPNKVGSAPQAVPSASFPANAREYVVSRAIGGGPVLVKNGDYQNTWEAELYDASSGIGHNVNNPRTAIGFTDKNRIILFVCEGRNMTPGVPGFTLEETAKILMDLGCIEALNLDGGGSTCMLVNGQEVIKPSDGRQRSVVTAIGLK